MEEGLGQTELITIFPGSARMHLGPNGRMRTIFGLTMSWYSKSGGRKTSPQTPSATKRGIIVVEAAGNGSQDLNDPIYNVPLSGFPSWWQNPFDLNGPDSTAILAGAGAPPPGTHGTDYGPDRSRLGFSNYGSRLNAQGWGGEVTTTGYGDLQWGDNLDLFYTDMFSGTSSATPIVAGALACVQAAVKKYVGPPITPSVARVILMATGSPQQDATLV